MVENVIENAIVHNQPEGWLRTCTAVEGMRAQLVVENGGERLDPDVVKELSRPFRRAAPNAPARTAAPAWGSRSSLRSPESMAARSTSPRVTTAGCGS
jgi:uncharacterized membrane-anchored protein